MAVNIGLRQKQRQGVVQILSPLLADEYLLYTKTRNYHWNVTGPQFNDLHKFFETQYEALDDVVDDVAERIRAVGSRTVATLPSSRSWPASRRIRAGSSRLVRC